MQNFLLISNSLEKFKTTNLTNMCKCGKCAYFRHVFVYNFFFANFYIFSVDLNQHENINRPEIIALYFTEPYTFIKAGE
jgi:hypothetical protein